MSRPIPPSYKTRNWPAFAALTLLSILAFRWSADRHEGPGWDFDMRVWALAAIVSAGLVVFGVRQVWRGGTVVIMLDPAGYRDIRKSDVWIPWSQITQIKAWTGRYAQLRLTLSERMALTLFGRPGLLLTLRAWNHVSLKPVFVSAAGTLDTKPKRLEHIAKVFAEAHGGPQRG